ncbi:putative zinc finger BED domain-containing protein 1-like [Triplophysa rosa]|uniref:Zinc finger BED domain-containing protein 1-like n=1 Tax=Triplophysa rosa TaxID=992332 RepID=A0A9W8CBW2_TRIRA|nr:putative zinc finger BED domain-containing protein 1-like [Triplophysa rosa]
MTTAHFSKSAVDSYLLEKKQKLLEVKSDKLINDCPTRWNSTHDMINRALEQQAPVAAVIFEKKMSHLELTTSEWVLMELVKNVLQPFKTATEALSIDKYPTASAVLPLQHVLVRQLQPNSNDSSAVKEMKMKIAADLQSRYPNEKQAFMLLNTASYLDPRFHRLNHLPEEQKTQVRAKILSELTTIMEESKSERADVHPDAKKRLRCLPWATCSTAYTVRPKAVLKKASRLWSMRWICLNEKLRYPLTKTLSIGGKNRAVCTYCAAGKDILDHTWHIGQS